MAKDINEVLLDHMRKRKKRVDLFLRSSPPRAAKALVKKRKTMPVIGGKQQQQQLYFETKPRPCRKCGMFYQVGEKTDEKSHEKFCQNQHQLLIPVYAHQRILSRLHNGDRIIEIRPDDSSSHLRKMKQVKELMDKELGFIPDDVFTAKKYFLYINQQNLLLGCIAVEHLDNPVQNQTHTIIKTYSYSSQDNLLVEDLKKIRKKTLIGISQMWVAHTCRRQKIATQLLDKIRQFVVYGYPLDKQHIAFSPLSTQGVSFASNYMKPHQICVYTTANADN